MGENNPGPQNLKVISKNRNNGSDPTFVWIREEPFEYGVLPQTCKQLGTGILQKTASYIKEKGFFPKMSLSQWIHIGTLKMQLPYDLAWNYFRLFDSITRSQDSYGTNGKWDIAVQETYHYHKGQRSVCNSKSILPTGDDYIINTSQFLLFLYIQHWKRPYKRLNNAKLDESWPQTDTKTTEYHKSEGMAKKLIREHRCINFISHQLLDIISFLNLGEQNSDRVQFENIQALDLIIAIADCESKIEYTGLEKLVNDNPIADAIGYKKSDNTVDKLKFARWVKQRLYPNPWSSSSSAIVMKNVDAQTGTWDGFPVNEFNRVWHNNQSPPKLWKWCTISTVNNQVFYYDKFKPFTSLKIHRCQNSTLYIPGIFRYVTIEKCRNTTVFLGPVACVLRFVSCENMKFHGICRSTIIIEVVQGDFYIMSLSQPIICGGKNRNLRLAPYNTFYSDLHKHIQTANISIEATNLFHIPLDLGYDGQPKESVQDLSYTLMKPDDFFESLFPFGTQGGTRAVPFEIPANYAKVINQRKAKTDALKEKVLGTTATFDDEKRSEFQKLMHVKFLTWLHAKGHNKFLNALECMDEAETAGTLKNMSVPSSFDIQGKSEEAISKRINSLMTGTGGKVTSLNPETERTDPHVNVAITSSRTTKL